MACLIILKVFAPNNRLCGRGNRIFPANIFGQTWEVHLYNLEHHNPDNIWIFIVHRQFDALVYSLQIFLRDRYWNNYANFGSLCVLNLPLVTSWIYSDKDKNILGGRNVLHMFTCMGFASKSSLENFIASNYSPCHLRINLAFKNWEVNFKIFMGNQTKEKSHLISEFYD